MSRFLMDYEWEEPGRARGDELRATWARLAVRIDGTPITRLFDRRSRSLREAVYMPLYPLAEGIAANWWAIQFEVNGGRTARHPSFDARHDLGRHLDGFALPRLCVAAEPPAVRLTWGRRARLGSPVDFLESGDRLLPKSEVMDELRRFVDSVCIRLSDRGVAGTWLQNEWEAIIGADDDETEYCRLVAAVGLHPYDSDPATADLIMCALSTLPESVRDDFLCIADPVDPVSQASALVADLDRATDQRTRLPKEMVEARTRARGVPAEPAPWSIGYQMARDVRSRLGLGDEPIQSLTTLGLPQNLSQAGSGAYTLYDAVVSAPDPEFLGIVTNRPSAAGKRFAVARCIGDWAWSRGTRHSGIMTSAATFRQQLSRAFAAELLAPISAVRCRLPSDYAGPENLDDIADEFGVSDWVIRHQIQNQLLDVVLAA
jgi:hypothetical protein